MKLKSATTAGRRRPALTKLRGDEGARSLIAAHPEWLTEVPVEGEPPNDIDTRDDYQRAVDRVRNETIRAFTFITRGQR